MNRKVIEDISERTLKEIKNFDYEPYPYYYTKIFNSILKEDIKDETNISKKLLLTNYLDESQLSKNKEILEKFSDSNEKISEVSNNFFENIKSENTISSVKHIIERFEDDLVSELEKSNEEVKSLKKELELAYKKLKIDALTKTLNRGALNEDLESILKFGKDKDLDLFLVILDLDDFKKINDTYGHIVGDKILISIAKIFTKSIRMQDKVYRYGGDEFVILFNRSNLNIVKAITKRILEKISHTIFKIQDTEIKLTVSIGIAPHKKGDTADSLIARADDALYETKKSGKNSIQIKQ